jgi:hypothetical protein
VSKRWQRLAARLCDAHKHWNVIGADLIDSPHGMSWGPAPTYPPPAPSLPIEPDPLPCHERAYHLSTGLRAESYARCSPPPPPPHPPPVGAYYWADERWDAVAGRLGDVVLGSCPRWMLFVQGVGFCQTDTQPSGCEYPSAAGQDRMLTTWWAENVRGSDPLAVTSLAVIAAAR